MATQQYSIGIIGTGRFGSVLHKLFSQSNQFSVKLASTSKPVDHQTIFPLEEVVSSDCIFPAIPISHLRPWLAENKQVWSQCTGTWVSVCSVMEEPTHWLKESLPLECPVIGSHPIFGPTSSKQGTDFNGLPWVFDLNGSHVTEDFAAVIKFLEQKGIIIHTISAEDHDQIMARSQAVAFLFGSIGQKLKFNEGPFDTVGFQHLMANQRIYEQDSHQLLIDMFRYNRFARDMLKQVQSVIETFGQEVFEQK